MAETRQQETPGSGEAGRDRGGRAAQEAQRAGAGQIRQGAEAGAESAMRGGEAAASRIREGAEAGATTMRRAAQDVAAGGQRIAESTAHEVEESTERYAEALRHMAHDLSRLLMMPRSANGGLQEMQEAMGQLMNGVMRSNLRMTQEMFRRTNPGAVVELQGAFIRDYLGALVEGGATVLRATRRTADEALRPLEERMERGNGAQDRHGPRVADVMTRDVRVVNAEESVQQAARLMAETDAGVMPVGENDRLVGMVTDRDLTLRVLAEAKDPAKTKVREVMTPGTRYVYEDEDIDEVAQGMRAEQVRRMPVLNRDKRLVGIVSLGDLAREAGPRRSIGRAFADIVRDRDERGASMR